MVDIHPEPLISRDRLAALHSYTPVRCVDSIATEVEMDSCCVGRVARVGPRLRSNAKIDISRFPQNARLPAAR